MPPPVTFSFVPKPISPFFSSTANWRSDFQTYCIEIMESDKALIEKFIVLSSDIKTTPLTNMPVCGAYVNADMNSAPAHKA
jgi:hypothetical protein